MGCEAVGIQYQEKLAGSLHACFQPRWLKTFGLRSALSHLHVHAPPVRHTSTMSHLISSASSLALNEDPSTLSESLLWDKVDIRRVSIHSDVRERRWTISFLFVGAVSGLCCFAFAFLLGILRFNWMPTHNFVGEDFPSGVNFHPATVSEMVNDPTSVEGKCFHAFGMIGAICILVSGYPWILRNVYKGDDLKVPIVPFWSASPRIPALTLRHFLPPVGMMIVLNITVTSGERDQMERWGAIIHTVGAVTMIGGYMICEIHCLWWSSEVRRQLNSPATREMIIRKVLIIACAVSAVGFEILGVVLASVDDCGAECSCDEHAPWSRKCTDQWVDVTLANVTYAKEIGHLAAAIRCDAAMWQNKTMLSNTARGWVLTCKEGNCWFESLAGVFMLASHLVIWYYAPVHKFELITDSSPSFEMGSDARHAGAPIASNPAFYA